MTTTTAPTDWLRKVEALIAKADSTEHTAEAEAFMAKAQELMRRHAIDEAMLAAAGGHTTDEITSRTVNLEAPYASAKASLLAAVAAAQNVRAIMVDRNRVEIIGFSSDLDATEFLYGSLVTYAARTMLASPVPAYESAKAFRHGFLLGFASRMNERFIEANKRAADDHETETGSSSALVLADRKRAVDSDFRQRYPRTQTRRSSSSSGAGRSAGARAANSASMSRGGVGSGSRRALGA